MLAPSLKINLFQNSSAQKDYTPIIYDVVDLIGVLHGFCKALFLSFFGYLLWVLLFNRLPYRVNDTVVTGTI